MPIPIFNLVITNVLDAGNLPDAAPDGGSAGDDDSNFDLPLMNGS